MTNRQTPHEQDMVQLVDRLRERLENWATESVKQAGEIGDLKRELAETKEAFEAAIAAKRYLGQRISLGQEGWNEIHREAEQLRAERDALKATVERVRADCKAVISGESFADDNPAIWVSGAQAHAKRTLAVLDGTAETGELAPAAKAFMAWMEQAGYRQVRETGELVDAKRGVVVTYTPSRWRRRPAEVWHRFLKAWLREETE
jgi:hypothetical protein